MEITTIKNNGNVIALLKSKEVLISDVQSALDLMATINYEIGSGRIVLDKEAICEDFFDLKTQLAGEIIQKFVNYQVKVAIVGDFSKYTSKSFNDFIYECNNGSHIFFLDNVDQAVEKLS